MMKKIGILALLVTLVGSTAVATVMACTWTPGYWKNHPEAWPTNELTIGGETYIDTELMEFLWTPVRGDVWINLMQKVIAMRLSILVVPGSGADTLLQQADTWFAAHPEGTRVRPNTPDGQDGLAIASQLDYLLNLWDVD